LYEIFRDHIDSADAKGETKLWDSVEKALESLHNYKKKNNKAALRILVLSDGEDTDSRTQCWQVAKSCQEHDIVCDSVMIGEGAKNKMLRALAKSTGGYCFAPKDLKSALKLMELETFLTLSERPDSKLTPRIKTASDIHKFSDTWLYPLDECSDERVPERRAPPQLSHPSLTLEQVLDDAETKNPKTSSVSRVRRILKDLNTMLKAPHPAIDIYPSSKDIGFWKLVLESPAESPYKEGIYLLYASFPPDYPSSAPEIRFVTPVRHCNV